MANWSTTTKHEPSSINNGRRYELRDRVSIEQLNNMTENSFYAMEASSVAKEKAEEALKFAQGSGTTVYENGNPVAEFNADKKANVTDFENYYTKEQVDDLVSTGGSSDVDLSNYYTKDQTYSKEEVDDKLANLEVDIDFSDYYTKSQTDNLLENKANKTEIPDVSNFITKAVSDLENYYTKSETYTQDEIKNLVSAIPKFSIKVVTELPTTDISETTVYLVASGNESQNLYIEYIYINGTWEKLGEQKIDLSNYYNKIEVDDLVDKSKLSFEKVVSLPPFAEVKDNTIYLLQHGTGSNVYYTEHIYIDDQWEQFGTNVDENVADILDNTSKIKNQLGGFAGGDNATARTTGGAIGKSASTGSGGAVGEDTISDVGFAGGYSAKTLGQIEGGTVTIDAIQLGTGTNAIEKSLQVYDDNIYNSNTHTLTVKNIELDGEPLSNSSSFMPVGSIFASAIPQEDARVHLLDGLTIPQTGVYETFANLIKELDASGKPITCTQSEFDADVLATGNCGKFVIDNDAGTIRLPKITTFIQGLSSITNIGSSLSAGLPNITGKLGHDGLSRDMTNSSTYEGALYKAGQSHGAYGSPSYSGSIVIGFDASRSNSIYGNSTTVQPNATQYPYYIVLASGYKSSQVVDFDNIMNEINDVRNEHKIETVWTGSVIGGNTIAVNLSDYKYFILEFTRYNAKLHCVINATNSYQIAVIHNSKTSDNGLTSVVVEVGVVSTGISYTNCYYYYQVGSTLTNHSSCPLTKIVGVK